MAMTRVRPGRFNPLARPQRGAQAIAEPRRGSAVVDWAAYIDGRRVVTETVADAVRLVRDGELTPVEDAVSGGFVWVGMHEPEPAELEHLAGVFGLHPLAVEDALQARQRPKLERYDNVTIFVIKTVGLIDHGPDRADTVETGQIMIFCGPDFVVTVRHGPHRALGPVRAELEDNPERLALGPAAVLHAIADRVVDDYLCVADAVQEDVDELEEAVFSPERTSEASRIYRLKREVIHLKRAVGPLAAPLRTLAGRRFVPTEIKEYFRDVEDHLTRVREQVESCDELLTPILQAHMTQVTVDDNQDMRKISAWAAIISVPTAVAGVYGMNFKFMPELRWHYGYPMILTFTFLACVLLHRGFRRNGWL
jgi:magnesium transporter